MIPVALAAHLRDSGLLWEPAPGDRFVIDQPELQSEVFLLSDMTVELFEHPTGRIIRFNGTTEWALDSVQEDEAIWLPSEEQLREWLADSFLALHRVDGRYAVTFVVDGEERTIDAAGAAEAYGLAVLAVLRS